MSNYQVPTGDEPKVEVRPTADGSPTLYVPALDEHYHSRHGARQESRHVFVEAGLAPLLAAGLGQPDEGPVRVLEVGLGTGLNALLTLEAAMEAQAIVEYDGYELLPLPTSILATLATQWDDKPLLKEAFEQLHAAAWGEDETIIIDEVRFFTKIQQPIQTANLLASRYHLIYFDAFAPEKQPELWTPAVFEKLYAAAAPGAVLVSYCAQGQFRRNLRAAGWLTEKLPGPPGKREMTRARKPG